MLFGRGSTGGVINQVSKLPTLTPFATANVIARHAAVVPGHRGRQPADRRHVGVPGRGDGAGRHSTRDVMQNHDYGVAPSLRFGMGTPTEITLNALLTHNNDMPDYGLPPVNGAPAAVNRKNFYGATDDRTIQDVINLNGTITHKITGNVTLRNQT